MRLWPRSIFGRLLGIAAITTAAALAFAALAIGGVLERFVTRGLDQQLDAQVGALTAAVGLDGGFDPSRAISLPAFEQPNSGWGWRIDGAAGHWARGAAFTTDDRRPPAHWRAHGRAADPGPRPGEGRDAGGERIHFRQSTVATEAGPVLITASGPRRVAVMPLREAMTPLLGSLALLGGALGLATIFQLRLGLRPLRQLQHALGDVRAGRLRHIPGDQPAEIAPLAAELNALIDENEAGLAHARRHISNLAHGLKTPLAALGVALAESGRDLDGSLGKLVADMDGRVRHHLGRARAATPGQGRRASTLLATAVADLVSVLQRINAHRPVAAKMTVPPELAAAVDRQDLDEMVGNLLDNAWRYARSTVWIEACVSEGRVTMTVDDDGPGLGNDAIAEALIPGRRLDERGDGHGFGLSITEELADLNGGKLMLGRSAAGGLRATLNLPLAG